MNTFVAKVIFSEVKCSEVTEKIGHKPITQLLSSRKTLWNKRIWIKYLQKRSWVQCSGLSLIDVVYHRIPSLSFLFGFNSFTLFAVFNPFWPHFLQKRNPLQPNGNRFEEKRVKMWVREEEKAKPRKESNLKAFGLAFIAFQWFLYCKTLRNPSIARLSLEFDLISRPERNLCKKVLLTFRQIFSSLFLAIVYNI